MTGPVTKPETRMRAASGKIASFFPGKDAYQARTGRLTIYAGYSILLVLVFIGPLCSLAVHAATTDLNSYILLVPFISAYLLRLRSERLPGEYLCSPGCASAFFSAGLLALAAIPALHALGRPESQNDYLTLTILAFVCFLAAGGYLFLGRKWMGGAAFAICFLFFLVPLPDVAVDWLEANSRFASTQMADLLFRLGGVPFLRDGTIFQLPGITFEVAQECSGMHSSWVLFITSLLVAFLFLKTGWRRLILVAFVIPLGILRNGLRIFAIGWLCVHYGPRMIDSFVHKHGGPIFFAVSLVPLLLLLWWLRSGERLRAPGRSKKTLI